MQCRESQRSCAHTAVVDVEIILVSLRKTLGMSSSFRYVGFNCSVTVEALLLGVGESLGEFELLLFRKENTVVHPIDAAAR